MKKIVNVKELKTYFLLIIIAIILAVIIRKGILLVAEVPTNSMENTIMTDEKILALRTAYWFKKPERGDIVAFRFPDDESQDYLKRVIGLPGETIEVRDGLVYINGSETSLQEDYLKDSVQDMEGSGDYGPYVVPQNCYFMLGDNRLRSEDSRKWENTYVAKSKILGKAIWKKHGKWMKIEEK